MQGFDENKLLELCDEKYVHNGFALWNYWTAENYSFGRHIRRYAFFLPFLPLNIYTDHGAASLSDKPYAHELEAKAYCQFYHSPELVNNWKKYSNKPCYTLYSPFVSYRRKNKIEQNINAKGTLAFPAHSTTTIEDVSDIEEYIKQLKELPEEFQPISVCLHMHDVNKKQYEIFTKHKIPVYTAGHVCDYRFAERFYNIARNFKYTTSNMIGSYSFYCVEMGIPFSLYGNSPILMNTGDPNVEIGEWNQFKSSSQHIKMQKLFEGLQKTVTDEQKNTVEKDLGLIDGCSRFEMAKILYLAYFKQGNLLADLIYPFVKYSKRPRHLFKQTEYELFKKLW